MGGYIRIDKDTAEDPRLLDLADDLSDYLDIAVGESTSKDIEREFPGVSGSFSDTDARDLLCNAMIGGLVHLWTYGDTHVRSDNSLPLTGGALARVMRLPEWVVYLYPGDWLTIDEENRQIFLPGFVEKNGIEARDIRKTDKDLQRAKWAEKKRRQRAKQRGDMSPETGGRDMSTCPPVRPGPVPRTPVPVPVPLTPDRDRDQEGPKTHTQHGALASAQGHLARRPKLNGKSASRAKAALPPPKTQAELELDVIALAKTGMQSADIARVLGQYGITTEQVAAWLANVPPETLIAAKEGGSA